ncbi:OPT oligopeptide transporter protein-domain-containing protein [Favolaschia claudopus]|uniref:OPT oligopeptide transporter protein-domain-containing protein n=1 Tax=Favolaschia claudopus TaxID=2862362 RepID=A0AAW0C3Q8_9AGAR
MASSQPADDFDHPLPSASVPDFEHQGGNNEFTLQAVCIGLLIGCLLCFANLSFGLQTGWISMMSLQSALIGFLISRLLPIPLSAQEVIVVQTTAVATGTMPLAAGFVGIIPALKLLDKDRDGALPINLSWIAAIGWSCSIAFFGVFLSPPIRKQVIVHEQLAFPSGTATAQLIAVLHKMPPPDTSIRRRVGYIAIEDEETDTPPPQYEVQEAPASESVQTQGWHALASSFAASGALTLFAYFFPAIFSIPLFGTYLAREWLWTFTPSLAYVGQGIIMGFPTTLSMSLGMILGWGVLSPISKHYGWAPGPVGDMTNGARGWILWTSLAIMCADSLISLLPVVAEYIVDLLPRRDQQNHVKEDYDIETEDRLVPTSWVVGGLVASVVVGTFLVWLVFGDEGIKPWATLLGFALGGLLSILGVRALGETDINPVSGLGKISQLFFAWIQPGNIVANLIAGGVAEAGAQQAGDLMQDLKTGHLCGASPRAQFFGQLIGSAVSILVTTTGYSLYNRAYVIPGPSFPAPTAYVWLSLARLLRDGELPQHSGIFMISFAALFAIVSALKTYAERRQVWYTKWIPSGVAFAIGFLNTPSFTIARLIGGVVEHVFRSRYAKNRSDIRLIVIASGFVLGEGVVSVVSLILKTMGVGTDLHLESCRECYERVGHVFRHARDTLPYIYPCSAAPPNTMSRLELAKISALTFYKDSFTEARRTEPIPQLVCVGKPCKLYQPEVVRCQSLGGSGTDIEWKCEADLPSTLRFGRVEVGCEGYNRPGDPFVLRGSCSLEYRLVQVPGALRDSDSDNWLGRNGKSTFVWLGFLAIILYSFLQSCLRGQQNQVGGRPNPGRPGNFGPGGFFPGGFNNDDSAPPPPYSKNTPTQNEGWRPGFWTGALLGGLGTQFFSNRQNQNQNSRAYDWERERDRSYHRPPPTTNSWFGQRSTSRPSQQEDRGEGSSNLGSMRQSTGFGGSNTRSVLLQGTVHSCVIKRHARTLSDHQSVDSRTCWRLQRELFREISCVFNAGGALNSAKVVPCSLTLAMKNMLALTALAIAVAVSPAAAVAVWGQCGGIGYTGSTVCDAGSTCVTSNQYYSQCLPSSTTVGTTSTATTTSSAPPTSSGSCANRTKFKYFGVNESGAEFGNTVIPGTWGKDFTFPAPSSIDVNAGFNFFRMPFLMERLVPPATGITGPFNSAYLANITTSVNYITGKGAYVALDPHNFMIYNGAAISSTSDFQKFWTNLAGQFKSNTHVVFDVMNEPHDIPASTAFALNQAAVNGIRASGATSQLILVEGLSCLLRILTFCIAWSSSGNAAAFTAIKDPNNNLAVEMHQYLDSDGSGTSATCVSSTIGVERISNATAWLKSNNLKGFLGEIGAGNNAACISAVSGALCSMQQSGVWIGAAWWAAGPWWDTYFQSIEPPNGAAIAQVLPQALMPYL